MPQSVPPHIALRVGYVLKRYPRHSETFIVNEILAHEEAGHKVEIFALRSVEETHFQDIIGRVRSPVTRVPSEMRNAETFWSLMHHARAVLPGAWAALSSMGEAEGSDVKQALMIALACREKGMTHLHAHFGTVATSVARLAAALAGITYSFTAHAKDIYCEYEEPLHLDAKIADAATVVTVSDFNVAYLKERFGPAPGQITRIYNGLDLDRFVYARPGTGAHEILAVGRLVEKKGFDILIEAMRLMREAGRDVVCRIVGDGEERGNLAAQIAADDLGATVRLEGPKPQADVIRAMQRAAVLACPCIVGRDGNRDGLPTVLLEAMALGLPSVATDVTGIPELVRDGETGLIVPEGDPEVLAAALGRMLDDLPLRQRLSSAGRALIERDFDVRTNAARLREVFAAAAGEERVRGAA